MKSLEFRRWQSDHIRDPHVADLNGLVEDIRDTQGEFAPYVSPEFGGRQARVLFLLASPGIMTNNEADNAGSGFLSVENPDIAAERIAEAMDEAGLSVRDCVGWNVCPWYVEGFSDLTSKERRPHLLQGSRYLTDLIVRLPELRVVFTFGEDALRGWEMFAKDFKKTARSLENFHHRSTGSSGYIGKVEQREEWRLELVETMKNVKDAAAGPYRFDW